MNEDTSHLDRLDAECRMRGLRLLLRARNASGPRIHEEHPAYLSTLEVFDRGGLVCDVEVRPWDRRRKTLTVERAAELLLQELPIRLEELGHFD